jgi:hypothetical protein
VSFPRNSFTKAAPLKDDSKEDKPQLVAPDAGKKRRKPLTPDEELNNFCKAMGEQELFEAGAFPSASDAGDVRKELQKMERSFVEDEAKRRRKAFTVARKPEQ